MTTGDCTHGHHQMANIEIKQTMELETGDREAKTRPRTDCGKR